MTRRLIENWKFWTTDRKTSNNHYRIYWFFRQQKAQAGCWAGPPRIPYKPESGKQDKISKIEENYNNVFV